jgi:hypothetical protein
MTLALVLVVLSLYQSSPLPQRDWDAAERNIVRLRPADFPALPPAIRAYLEKRICTIPQAVGIDQQPNNVIRGRFTSARQMDLAVMCSVNRRSTILVFRGGSVSDVAELRSGEDKGCLQGLGPNTIGFSCAIFVASPASIRAYYKGFGGPKPPPLDHDGIEDAYVGKASTVLYWFGGKWLELAGMD